MGASIALPGAKAGCKTFAPPRSVANASPGRPVVNATNKNSVRIAGSPMYWALSFSVAFAVFHSRLLALPRSVLGGVFELLGASCTQHAATPKTRMQNGEKQQRTRGLLIKT